MDTITNGNSGSGTPGVDDRLEARKRRQREAVHRYQRKKRLEQRQFVTPEQLEALRADPESCKGVCRNCGQILKDVGPHLARCPAGPMKELEYKTKWGFPRTGNATRSEEKQQSYERPETSAGIQRRMETGRAIQLERYRIARHEWEVIVLRVNGRSLLDIAEKLKFATRKPVRTAVRSVDLPEGKRYICDRGVPFTRGSAIELCQALGQSRQDFARLISTAKHPVTERRIQILYTNRHKHLDPVEAHLCTDLRDRIARAVLAQEGKRGLDSYDRRAVLGALFPRYREEYKTLGWTLRSLGAFLDEKPDAQEADIAAFVLEQAQAEKRGEHVTTAADAETCFRDLLRWLAGRKPKESESPLPLPELMTAIVDRRAAIAGTKNPHRVAVEILAETMSAPAKIVLDAIEEQIEPASPEKMRYILRSFPQFAPPAEAKPKTPKQRGPAKYTLTQKREFEVYKLVEEKILAGADLIAARDAVVKETHLERSTVVRYHGKCRSLLKKRPPEV